MWLPSALLFLSLPGCFPIRGPTSVSGTELGSVTVQCDYDVGWETNRKWWCRGKRWRYCKILIQSTGTEQEVKSGRISIKDNHGSHFFTVTIDKLRRDDANTYWCGIEKTGTDLGVQVQVTVGSVLAAPTNRPFTPLTVSYIRTHYLLLAFVKVPILLIVLGAILWLKGSQRAPKEQRGQPANADFSVDCRTKGTAPCMGGQYLLSPDPGSGGKRIAGSKSSRSIRNGCSPKDCELQLSSPSLPQGSRNGAAA
ncbi:CMRF35-like molecule 7 [Tenrec ecaudatus]|uniref:CMRF35-like molecule 7 n=1 Tax=Tenrec ecaudatus TaxID=94439 RepID=UPI003F5918F2